MRDIARTWSRRYDCMNENTTMRWPNLWKTAMLPACQYSNNSPSLRPGQKVQNHRFQQQRTTTTFFAIMLSYGHLQTQVPVHLGRLWTRTRKHNHNRKPIRSVIHKPKSTRLSITGRSHRTTMQAIAEHRPTPHYLRCQKWHRNRHDSASLRNTTPITACSPHHRQVIQRPIHHITRISQPVLSAVRAFPMPRTELLLPRGQCYLHHLV
jgi:hypothetical protein